MKALHRLGSQPVSLPLFADDVVEFHAARLVLLMYLCGIKGRINGLTKMAKLDFFTRYPHFFDAAKSSLSDANAEIDNETATRDDSVESAMVRHHYGPWDKRYYHILSYLEARALITVSKVGNSYQIGLTELGVGKAKTLASCSSFSPLVRQMQEVKAVFGSKTGTYLKQLIYKLFDEEVAKLPMGKKINL